MKKFLALSRQNRGMGGEGGKTELTQADSSYTKKGL